MFALNENQPANHRNHCIKVSPLKPTAKLENLDYIREILQFPFTVELNLGADGFQRYAVFDFESHEVAAEALKIIRVHLGCRRYNSPVYDFNSQAYFHNPRPFIPINDSRPRAVYVGNLGPTTTLEDLQNFAANTFDSGFVGVWMGNRLISDVNLRTTCYGTFLFETADDTHGAFHRLLRLKLTNQLDPEILPKCQIEFSRKFREYGYQQLPAAELREANYRQQPIFLLNSFGMSTSRRTAHLPLYLRCPTCDRDLRSSTFRRHTLFCKERTEVPRTACPFNLHHRYFSADMHRHMELCSNRPPLNVVFAQPPAPVEVQRAVDKNNNYI